MFTTCNKRGDGPDEHLGLGPSVYLWDQSIPQDTKKVFFTSLPGGISKPGVPADLIDLESQLRGQNSYAQVFCRQVDKTEGQVMPWRPIPQIKQNCSNALVSEVTSLCPQRHVECSHSTNCGCGARCACKDIWRNRNMVPSRCMAPRMAIQK